MVVHKKVPKPKVAPKFPDDKRAKQARKQIEMLYAERSSIRLELLEKYTNDDEVKIYTEVKDYIIYSNDYYLSKARVNDKWVVTYRVNKYGAIEKKKNTYLNFGALYRCYEKAIEDAQNTGCIVVMADEHGHLARYIKDHTGVLQKIQTAPVLKTTEIY